jgi:hypothetical protein
MHGQYNVKSINNFVSLYLFIYLFLHEQLRNENVRALHASSNIMRMTKLKRETWSPSGEIRNAYTNSVSKV